MASAWVTTTGARPVPSRSQLNRTRSAATLRPADVEEQDERADRPGTEGGAPEGVGEVVPAQADDADGDHDDREPRHGWDRPPQRCGQGGARRRGREGGRGPTG